MPAEVPEPSSIDPDAILDHPFPTVRKGYDPLEVQKYLMALAGALRQGRDRERDLERRLAEATRRADELENMSPQRLTAMLGEETAKVIEAANAAAADIKAKAEENVARLLRDAQDQADKLRREAESVLERKTAEAEEAAAAVRAEAERHLEQARARAEAEIEAGRERGREVVTEAQRTRERLLRDLARRRKTLRQQIEQLQAGRDRLVEAFDVVRRTVDESTHELDVALPEAKAAADAALQRAIDDDEAFEDELAELTAEVEAALVSEDDGSGDVEDDEDLLAGSSSAGTTETTSAAAGVDDVGDELVAEGEVELEEEAAAPAGGAGPKAPDPAAGRHSSAVKVIPTAADRRSSEDEVSGSSGRVASLFARIRQEAEDAEGHGEAASRVAEAGPSELGTEATDLGSLPLDERLARVFAELERNVNRRVKRELSDEQNEVLDAVRRDGGPRSDGPVLPDPEAHVERYASAVYAPLSDAAMAGGQLLPADARTQSDARAVATVAREVAAELAAELVAPLRDRLEAAFAHNAGEEDPTGLSEALGAAYREWRTQRVEPVTAQAVVMAFNRGVLSAAAAGTRLRWHPDLGTPCKDCRANADSEGVVAHESFPSGHEAPPIHPGCRCLLVAASEAT